MSNPLLARFLDSPALVAPSQQRNFDALMGCLATNPDANKLLLEPAMSDEFWYPKDDWRSQYRPYTVVNGILLIPVKGILLNDFPWQIGSFATGYAYIWKAFERGMADEEVQAIALLSHSPGGEVAGNFDLVDKMFAMRGTKPVRAFAHEAAYSAAYSISSVADHIAVSRTGGVGSIGVVTAHVDVSKAMENFGYKVTFIHAPEDGHKVDGNQYEVLKPEVQKRIQVRINELYDVFVSTVARNRNMSEQDVRDTKALTYSASEAIGVGLADSVGSLEDSMELFSQELSKEEGDEEMAKDEEKKDVISASDHTEAVATARKEGVEVGKAEGLSEGAKAERGRINAILALDEAKARPKAALQTALKSDMSVEDAKAFLGGLDEEKAEVPAEGKNNNQDFSKAMDENQHGVRASADGGEEEGADSNDPSALARQFGMAGFKAAEKAT